MSVKRIEEIILAHGRDIVDICHAVEAETREECEADAKNAARWRMLPAFLEKYQIEYVGLIRDIDAALAAAGIVEHEAFPSELPRFRVATDVLRDRADEFDKEQK